MYLDHFGFEHEPFNITPDSRFLFSSKRHSEAMASLLYGIEQRKGFIALTGEIGAGKTTICRTLLKELQRDDIRLALIFNPQLNDLELLQAICKEYGIPAKSESKRELLDMLNEFLLSQYELGNNCVLVIDESQRLSPDALEQVRLISNLELETTKLIQIALVGQPELDDMLHLPELEQLNQRITVRCHIDPLDFEEMRDYIRHRVQVAGGKNELPFDKKALKLIYGHSGGVPRKINVLCDRVLLVAFVEGSHEIKDAHVRKALEEVQGRRARKSPAKEPDVPIEAGDEEDSVPAPSGGGLKWVAAALLVGCLAIASAVMTGGDRSGTASAEVAGTNPTTTPPSVTTAPETSDPDIRPVDAGGEAEPSPESSEVTVDVSDPTIASPATSDEVPVSTPAPVIPQAWSYDSDGVLRVEDSGVSYAAAVITWINIAMNDRLPNEELARLKGMPAAVVADLQLTRGKPPLHLRSAELPGSLQLLSADLLPALVQVDAGAGGYGPWSVATAHEGDIMVLADPIHGVRRVPLSDLETHLAGIVIPYSDPAAITNLRPNDEGERVSGLQRLLSNAGVYAGPESGVFDDATRKAVLTFREREGLPGEPDIDAMLALVLLSETLRSDSTP